MARPFIYIFVNVIFFFFYCSYIYIERVKIPIITTKEQKQQFKSETTKNNEIWNERTQNDSLQGSLTNLILKVETFNTFSQVKSLSFISFSFNSIVLVSNLFRKVLLI